MEDVVGKTNASKKTKKRPLAKGKALVRGVEFELCSSSRRIK